MVEDLIGKKINRWLNESEVIDILIHKDQPNDPLRAFYNIIYDPLKFDNLYGDRYTGFYVAKMINREELGFSSGTKPGDGHIPDLKSPGRNRHIWRSDLSNRNVFHFTFSKY